MKKINKFILVIILLLSGCSEYRTYQDKPNCDLLDNWKITNDIIHDTESEREIIQVFKISSNDTFQEIALEELNELFKNSYDLELQKKNDINDSEYFEATVIKDICRLTNDSTAAFNAILNKDFKLNSFIISKDEKPSKQILKELINKNIYNEQINIRVSDNPVVVNSELPLLPHAVYFVPVYKLVKIAESTGEETFSYDIYTPMKDSDQFSSGYFVIVRGKYVLD